MSGLSGSQAAATLATTLVGARLGLFDSLTINAVLVVILATLIITPAIVSIYGRKLSATAAAAHEVGARIRLGGEPLQAAVDAVLADVSAMSA